MNFQRFTMTSLAIVIILTVSPYFVLGNQNASPQADAETPSHHQRKVRSLRSLNIEQALPCIPRDYGRGSVVCVCNSTYCDSSRLTIPPHVNGGNIHSHPLAGQHLSENVDVGNMVQIFTSTKTGSRLHKSIVHFNNEPENPYRRNDMLSTRDHLRGRSARSDASFSPRLIPFLDNGRSSISGRSARRNGGAVQPSINKEDFDPILNDINTFRILPDYPRPEKLIKYTIRRDKRYQKVLGYGGAFTDAAGLNIKKLSARSQEMLMRSYFGEDGIDYSMGRVPIGGTDFSTRAYTLDDLSGSDATDDSLRYFSLQEEDRNLKIPFIHWAKALSHHKLKIFGSPWSAPAWMKTTGQLNGLGKLKKEYYQLWAEYFVKFIRAYNQENIDIWGLTTGNEPFNGFIPMWPFNCMGWSASDMRKFIANNLGPTLAAHGLTPKVMILDDNKSSVKTWASEILTRNDSARYVHGVGTHWYLDFLTSPDVLSKFHESYPDYFIVQTEACLGFTPWELEKVSLGNWERGEQYLEAIIHDSRNWVGAWIDWNLALDLKGGPNWAGLKADAAILVNDTADEFLKQPIYYGIGHVSKFVPPDSDRIELSADTYAPKNLLSVAFQRPDGGNVIVFLNKLNYDAKVGIRDPEKGYLYLDVPSKSFQTLVYW